MVARGGGGGRRRERAHGGDAAWKELLGGHSDQVRLELERYRGLEVTTTGDGFLVMFDGAARAIRCAAAIRDGAVDDGLQIRAGVHSGEVERQADNIRGVAVHAVTRIAALARPGEVPRRPPRACSRGPGSRSRTQESTS